MKNDFHEQHLCFYFLILFLEYVEVLESSIFISVKEQRIKVFINVLRFSNDIKVDLWQTALRFLLTLRRNCAI